MITGACGPIIWTKHVNDAIIDGGRPDSSSTVDSCKTKCVDNPDCTGVAWNGAQCMLHGAWNRLKQGKATTGIDYYRLIRNAYCAGKCHASLDLICTVDAKIFTNYQKKQESPAVADKPARRLRKVRTVYVRAVGL